MTSASWVGSVRFHGLLLPPGGGPALLLAEGTGPVVWDADRAARARGVRPGQPAAAARAACPEARVAAFDRAAVRHALDAAWDLLAAAAPAVEPDPEGRPEACVAWYGAGVPRPEVASLQAAAARALPHVDLALGVASVRLAARAARPETGCTWISPGAEAGLLAPLPLDWLVTEGLLAPARLADLHRLGLRRCGDLAAMPEAAVAARLGREGLRLRVACRGGDARPVAALHPPRTVRARLAWPDGLPVEGWADAAAALARRAAAGLAPGEGARRLRLCGDFPAVVRAWDIPRRSPGVFGRAASALAAGVRGPAATGFLEVVLEGLATVAPRPLSLLPTESRGPASAALEDLLVRLPRGVLRRGPAPPDRHEALCALLDPWRGGPG